MTREFEIDGTKVIILNAEKEEEAMRRLAEQIVNIKLMKRGCENA